MQITILIEPIEGGRFRVHAGEPFGLSAEGETPSAATKHLETMLRDRLRAGSRLATIDLGAGAPPAPQVPLQLDPLPDDDWFFQTMREAIAEERRREDEANS